MGKSRAVKAFWQAGDDKARKKRQRDLEAVGLLSHARAAALDVGLDLSCPLLPSFVPSCPFMPGFLPGVFDIGKM